MTDDPPGIRPVRPWVQGRWQVVWFILCAGLTAAASSLHGTPPGLAPCWLACGLTVGAAVRGPWFRVFVTGAAAMLAGAWLGDALNWRTAIVTTITLAQSGAVAWGLRMSLARMSKDPRPVYRVRLSMLLRFVLMLILPASLLAGLLLAMVGVVRGNAMSVAALAATHQAAASALSIAVLAPLTGQGILRTVSWRATIAAASAGATVAMLAAVDGRLLWLAPPVVAIAGWWGSIWAATLSVAGLGGGLLIQAQTGVLPPFEGPDGFVVWMLVVWRLWTTALIPALWSDRRGRVLRSHGGVGMVHPTAAGALKHCRALPDPAGAWYVVHLGCTVPAHKQALPARLPAGASLESRSALFRLAARVRGGDLVIGIDGSKAMLLLALESDTVPDAAALASRCKGATHDDLQVGRGRRLNREAVVMLLTAAAYLDSEPEGDPNLALPAGPDNAAIRGAEPALA